MRTEQAIYTSARTGGIRGYHLVARSSGIDEQQERSLVRWCPSHGGLANSEPTAYSLNFHPVTDEWVALSRTVYGGPEYSARGGLQIVTRILLLRRDELAGYEYDPVTLAQVALALGLLRLEPNAPETLPHVELPDRPLRASPHDCDSSTNDRIERLMERLAGVERVAVIGSPEPLHVLRQLFSRLPERQRLDVSFTTGLMPSLHRCFRLHFLPAAGLGLRQQLVGQRICPLEWKSLPGDVHCATNPQREKTPASEPKSETASPMGRRSQYLAESRLSGHATSVAAPLPLHSK